jgi:hypothetical protein
MLIKLGIQLDPVPATPEELEAKIASGEIKIKKTEAHIQKEKRDAQIKVAIAELPSWFQMAKNLKKHAIEIAAHYKKTGRIRCSPEQIAARLAVCDACPSGKLIIDGDNKRCSLCGCHLKDVPLIGEGGKATFEALTCEMGHWLAADGGI